VPDVVVGSDIITSQVGISNSIARHFASVFSSANHDPSFQLLKDNTEALLLDFAS
jgi:hypothetical protein